MTPLKKTLRVVTKGKPSARLNLSCVPKMLFVPVPVRSPRTVPVSRICCKRARYGFISMGSGVRIRRRGSGRLGGGTGRGRRRRRRCVFLGFGFGIGPQLNQVKFFS